jgi:hypothetical protein
MANIFAFSDACQALRIDSRPEHAGTFVKEKTMNRIAGGDLL